MRSRCGALQKVIDMRKRVFLLGATVALALGLALAPVQLSFDGVSVDTASAAGKSGGKDDCPPPAKKGNNGWGNGGGDGTNSGSGSGATSGSKSSDEAR